MFTTDAFTTAKQTKTKSWKNGKEIQGCVRLSCMKEDFSVRRCLTAKKATSEEKKTCFSTNVPFVAYSSRVHNPYICYWVWLSINHFHQGKKGRMVVSGSFQYCGNEWLCLFQSSWAILIPILCLCETMKWLHKSEQLYFIDFAELRGRSMRHEAFDQVWKKVKWMQW